MAEGLAERKLQQKLEKKLHEKAKDERRQFVRHLLINTKMSVEKIAMMANVSNDQLPAGMLFFDGTAKWSG